MYELISIAILAFGLTVSPVTTATTSSTTDTTVTSDGQPTPPPTCNPATQNCTQ